MPRGFLALPLKNIFICLKPLKKKIRFLILVEAAKDTLEKLD